jgi:hypothetical protein
MIGATKRLRNSEATPRVKAEDAEENFIVVERCVGDG